LALKRNEKWIRYNKKQFKKSLQTIISIGEKRISMKEQSKSNVILGELFNTFAQPIPNNYFMEIGGLMVSNKLSKNSINEVLKKYNFEDVRKHKDDGVNLIIEYIHLILADNHLTLKELENAELLKRVFKIKEGDLLRLKKKEVIDIMEMQMKIILEDKVVDLEEALYIVDLQQLFDLSYDELIGISRKLVNVAIEGGANPLDIDFLYIPDDK
jgi:hypothetical protein